MIFSSFLLTAAAEFGLNLKENEINAFSLYNELLLTWNEKINLTKLILPEEVAVKHIIDSLSLYDPAIFKKAANVIDVGTGAGFPGLPLKIVYPDLKLTLLDSLNKRLIFLQEVIDKLALKEVVTLHLRAEEAGVNEKYREKYDITFSRAVASLRILVEFSLPLVKLGGYFIAAKGARYNEELDEAQHAIKMLGGEISRIKPVKLPGLNDKRAVIYIKKISDTPKKFPRKAALIEKNPL